MGRGEEGRTAALSIWIYLLRKGFKEIIYAEDLKTSENSGLWPL
jgi:hypothetical protein